MDKADWGHLHVSPQALGIGDQVYNRATGVLEETFELEQDQQYPEACTVTGSTAMM